MRPISRYKLLWIAFPLALLAGCAAEPEPPEDTPPELSRQASARPLCRTDADCPQPGAPCRECEDGEFACPSVECVGQRCVYDFPQCEAPYEPCADKACGEPCTQCDPDDPDCFETAVEKYCQADASCTPLTPACANENACAAVLCPTGTECVVLESFPPQARCVPIEPTDPCAAVLCEVGSQCLDGRCVRNERVFCGGFAGIPCAGAGTCIDDPSDGCDPAMGGADCGGMCLCEVVGLCRPGYHWDGSPHVCGCVRDTASGS